MEALKPHRPDLSLRDRAKVVLGPPSRLPSLFKAQTGPMTTFNKNCKSFVSLNVKGKERQGRSPSQRRRNIFKYLIVVHFWILY